MVDIAATLVRRGLDARQVRHRRYRAPTPRERERRRALWLLAQGWSASKVAGFLDRDADTRRFGLGCRRPVLPGYHRRRRDRPAGSSVDGPFTRGNGRRNRRAR